MITVDINLLVDKNLMAGYNYLLELEHRIEFGNELYPFYGEFLKLVHFDKSYGKVRGFRLCCSLAKWDTDNLIDNSIDELLSVMDDDKPTNIRQYLMALHTVILFKPHLSDKIIKVLEAIDLSKFKETVKPLIEKDILDIKNKRN